jgi:hypothetical protein
LKWKKGRIRHILLGKNNGDEEKKRKKNWGKKKEKKTIKHIFFGKIIKMKKMTRNKKKQKELRKMENGKYKKWTKSKFFWRKGDFFLS